MRGVRRRLATSNHPFARSVRGVRRWFTGFTLPAPKVVTLPLLWTYLAVRSSYYLALRVFFCELSLQGLLQNSMGGVCGRVAMSIGFRVVAILSWAIM